MNDWQAWIEATWPTMAPGVSVPVPEGLPAPGLAGFTETALAEDHGQARDWILAMPAGRLHVWQMASGERFAHKDRIDPGAGAVDSLAHWIAETQTGRTCVMVAIGLAVLVALVIAFTKK